jgi:acetamidase/formamidase
VHIGACQHTIHDHSRHHAWDRALPPALEVEPGATVEFHISDASGGQLSRTSTAADVAALDFARVNPVTGPLFVRGAKPGDTLEVEVLEFALSGWGWTAIIPGFGLLQEHFLEPWLKHWELTPGARTARFADGIEVPVSPFPGTIGVAPPEPGPHSIVPPRAWGGNLDIKHLTAGTKLYLPVGVEGALFSVGDTHAAQGDGEVCGTAIESPMQIALRFKLRRDLPVQRPAFETFGAAPGDAATPGGSFVTTGVADDLMVASKQAVADMVDHLVRTANLSAAEAYALASVAVDLRVHEVVDVPNWVVGAWCPKGIIRR